MPNWPKRDINWNVVYEKKPIFHRLSMILFYCLYYSPIFVAVATQTFFNLVTGCFWLIIYLTINLLDAYYVTSTFDDFYHIGQYIFMYKIPTIVANTGALVILFRNLVERVKTLFRHGKQEKSWLQIFFRGY